MRNRDAPLVDRNAWTSHRMMCCHGKSDAGMGWFYKSEPALDWMRSLSDYQRDLMESIESGLTTWRELDGVDCTAAEAANTDAVATTCEFDRATAACGGLGVQAPAQGHRRLLLPSPPYSRALYICTKVQIPSGPGTRSTEPR